jgi:hypothetical protein
MLESPSKRSRFNCENLEVELADYYTVPASPSKPRVVVPPLKNLPSPMVYDNQWDEPVI